MPKSKARDESASSLLLVDDEEDLRWLLASCLRDRGYDVLEAESGEAALALLDTKRVDVVVSDVRMDGMSGVDLLVRLREVDPKLPVVLMSALDDVRQAVGAMKLGAYDYLKKPFDNDDLLRVVERAVEAKALRSEVLRLRAGLLGSATRFGVSQAAIELERRVRLVADTPQLSVLIEGESGTGKEVIARTIHELSQRSSERFVAIDCGALPEALLESLLFGHRKGAFTGADRDRTGMFLEAHRGTLFLDELSNLPLGLQSKLLRCLQEREVRPLGGDAALPFDVRLICAANRDLRALTEAGKFRLDLYHRIAEFVLRPQPLRTRQEDVDFFADLFLDRIGDELGRHRQHLSSRARARLREAQWPGNLRELQNALRRAALLSTSETIEEQDLELDTAQSQAVDAAFHFRDDLPLTEQIQIAMAALERRWITEMLHDAGGNKA
ncbi:MAG TPA: sigma-54 dependent transcriptional regulator, partial [Planctomycetota bacterium]|nr:sigma-54 dependent transcriptional regulator [Planctomycetota bacterium]